MLQIKHYCHKPFEIQHVKNFLELRWQNLRMKMHKNVLQLFVTGPLILHDNARPHIADVVTKNLRDYGWEVLPHSPSSPDLSPPDLNLFPKLKEPMHGQSFSSLEELFTDATVTELFHT